MHVSLEQVAIGAGAFVGSLVLSTGAIAYVLVRTPADRFARDHAPFLEGHAPAVRLVARVGKNVLGVALVALGVVLSLPGVPGQGILTILLGVMLTDFPGKHRLERAIVCRPHVHRAIDKLRARYQKPPLVLPQKPRPRDERP